MFYTADPQNFSYVVKFDLLAGKELWRRELPFSLEASKYEGLRIGSGRLESAFQNGRKSYIFYPSDGAPVPDQENTRLAIESDDLKNAYFVKGTALICVNRATNAHLWSYEGLEYPTWNMHIEQGRIVCRGNSEASILDAQTGRLIWRVPMYWNQTEPLLQTKDFIVAQDQNHVACYSIEAAKVAWEKRFDRQGNGWRTRLGPDNSILVFEVATGKAGAGGIQLELKATQRSLPQNDELWSWEVPKTGQADNQSGTVKWGKSGIVVTRSWIVYE